MDNNVITRVRLKLYHLLRWSEKYTKTDMVYLTKGGFWLGGGQILTTATALATSIVFANLMPKESYGIFKYVLSIAALIAIPTLSGMDTAVTQAVARGYEGTIKSGLRAKLQWGSLCAIAGAILAIYFGGQGNYILAVGCLLAGLTLPIIEAFDIYNSLLNGRKMYEQFTLYNVITQISAALILIATIFLTNNLIILFASYFFSHAIINFLCFLDIKRRYNPNTKDSPETIRYGWHLTIVDIIGTFLGQLDKILIFHYLGAVELAIYTIALAPTEQLKGALKNINFLALPKFAQQSASQVGGSLFTKMLKFGMVISGLVAAYIALAPFAFKIFFAQYPEAVIYSQIVAISIVGASVTTFLYVFLEAQSAKKQLYQFNVINNLITIIISLPLIYFWGLAGAIIAKVIIRYLLLGVVIIFIKKITHKNVS